MTSRNSRYPLRNRRPPVRYEPVEAPEDDSSGSDTDFSEDPKDVSEFSDFSEDPTDHGSDDGSDGETDSDTDGETDGDFSEDPDDDSESSDDDGGEERPVRVMARNVGRAGRVTGVSHGRNATMVTRASSRSVRPGRGRA